MTTAIEALRQKYRLPALAVVVLKDGNVCDRTATGVRKLGDPAPVTTNDVFHIGSCTKSMTATLAAILIEQGTLRWDTTVGDMLPDWRSSMEPAYLTVTLEQLLTQRGGCPGRPPTKAWVRAWQQSGTVEEQRVEFVRAVLAQPPAAAPGSKFIYSNQGYTLVGAMLEKRTGRSWETLMREQLFQPLGMKSAGFGVPGTTGRVDQPWGHTRGLLKTTPVQQDNPPAIGPAGTVHCSLDDLTRFVLLHLERGQGGAGLLKAETFRRLHTPPAGGDYACGWVSTERTWAGGQALMHNGSNTMWYLVMWLALNRRFAVLAATNIAGRKAEQGCDAAVAAMIDQWLPQE